MKEPRKHVHTCLGGMPVSVATATKCAVDVLMSDSSPSTMSPESSIMNILKFETNVSLISFVRRFFDVFFKQTSVHVNLYRYYSPGFRASQRQANAIAAIAVRDFHFTDHGARKQLRKRYVRHVKLILRVPESWIPVVNVQHGDVNECRRVLKITTF